LRDLVAGFIGFKPKTEAELEKKVMTIEDMQLLMAATGGKIPGVGRR
jgi:hypothetical protein